MANERVAGRYRLVALLGAGGMSEVWRAEDEELERTVAVKLLRPDADRARFDREARAVAALSHSNITQLYDYGEAEGRPYMVLEYLPGGSLEERFDKDRAFPDVETARIATDVAAGLAHAHAHGLVHRDLKPANVLFDGEDRAKLADFGIARLGGAGTLTEAGTVLGTAAFISPEQASGEQATPASDVYSFGVILFRLLTGRLPFQSDEPVALATMHVTEPPPAVSMLRPDAPAALEAVVAASLAKDPRDRPPDGTALLRELTGAAPTVALATAAEPKEPSADTTRVLQRRPRPAGGPPPRPPRRRIPVAAAVAALLLLGAAGIAVAVIATRPSSRSAPTTSATTPSLSLPSVTSKPAPATPSAPPTTRRETTQQTKTRRTPPPTTAPPPPPETALPPTTAATTVATTATVPPTTTAGPAPGG